MCCVPFLRTIDKFAVWGEEFMPLLLKDIDLESIPGIFECDSVITSEFECTWYCSTVVGCGGGGGAVCVINSRMQHDIHSYGIHTRCC
jgi:hypothetical protein